MPITAKVGGATRRTNTDVLTDMEAPALTSNSEWFYITSDVWEVEFVSGKCNENDWKKLHDLPRITP